MQIGLAFDWEDAGDVRRSSAGRLIIPAVPAVPGIYCFRVSSASGEEVYIGESKDLRKRMVGNYASTHTGATNVRVREMLLGHLKDGYDVRLAIVCKVGIEVDGVLAPADLQLKDARQFVESAALALARRAGERIHNL